MDVEKIEYDKAVIAAMLRYAANQIEEAFPDNENCKVVLNALFRELSDRKLFSIEER